MLLVPQDLSYTEYRQPLMEVVEVAVKIEAVVATREMVQVVKVEQVMVVLVLVM